MELLDIYDENGIHIGQEDRKIVHKEGLWHKTVHCWLYDNEGYVYFQIRAKEGTLYTTSSGHLASGETVKEAFGREIYEELGLSIDYEKAEKINVVKFIMNREEKDGSIFKDRAFANIYMYNLDGDYSLFNFDPEEVKGVVKLKAKEALELLKTEEGTIKGIHIKQINNKIVTSEENFQYCNFLVNKGENGYEKYGNVLKAIINKNY